MGRPYSDDLSRRIVATRSGSSSFGHLGCRKRWRAVVQYQSLFSARCCAARKLPGLFRRVRLGKGKKLGGPGRRRWARASGFSQSLWSKITVLSLRNLRALSDEMGAAY